ncbi:MAG: adenylate kinase [Methanocalculus sp. MSAO_Arc1]|uniref:adenylate kinase n=1 Tax=Methanocalculus TaxID=71151 RepID=UPI000FF4CF24|nr:MULTISPECIES: adenylate kinase [unclassified Methanocalculus]MCP1663002.1 adenylate kinase [Methanocalculus sp. AMF5]RQD80622.1 MAG: adenylate kinase [Methanocalculus sp. MSAO_Arc1]
MSGKKIIITGVPGVGKTTVINRAMEILAAAGISYQNINFGSFMFEVAQSEGLAEDRDQMRKLDRTVQKRLQKRAAEEMAKIEGNVIIDTHASVRTPAGYLPGLPEWVLTALMPDGIVLVETDDDQILLRRLSDTTRERDMEGAGSIREHQQMNRSFAAAYAMLTGCTVSIVTNADHLLEQGADALAAVLR